MGEVEFSKKFDGRYSLHRVIGEGSFATVYLATDNNGSREVAVKVLKEAVKNEETVSRLIEEAKALALLDHPNIVRVLDFGLETDAPYLVCEYIKGHTLKHIIAEKGCLPIDEVLDWSKQLMAALEYAHSRSIYHRDIKSENVMVTDDGLVKLMDFGLAKRNKRLEKLTDTGVLLGTPAYMAPEFYSGAPHSVRTEIYAFGVVLYEMLTGKRPFSVDDLITLARKHIEVKPDDPRSLRREIPTSIAKAVLVSLSKDPLCRFATFTEFREAIESELSSAETRAVEFEPKMEEGPAGTVKVTVEQLGSNKSNWVRLFCNDNFSTMQLAVGPFHHRHI